MTTDLLFFTKNILSATQEILNKGGCVTHQLTSSIFVANIPDSIDISKLKFSRSNPFKPLDRQSKIIVDAWNNLNAELKSKSSTKKETSLESKYIAWDSKGYQAPGKIPPPYNTLQKSTKFTDTKENLYLTGSISVGLIIVSGVDSSLEFSDSEQRKVVLEVMKGLQFLANDEPSANITFIYHLHFITINAKPDPCDNSENCEAIWRDPALQQLGYDTGYDGCVKYVNMLRKQDKSSGSYVAFFTKYHIAHFAYAQGVKVVMSYSNDNWGPNNIHKVFAHETCHVFGAGDEYGRCDCSNQGTLKVPNLNCVNCTKSQIPCLMDRNVLSVCYFSRGQLGWWPKDRTYLIAQGSNGIWIFSPTRKTEPIQIPTTRGLDFKNGCQVADAIYLVANGGKYGIWAFDLESQKATPIKSTAGMRFRNIIHAEGILYFISDGTDGIWQYNPKSRAKPTLIESTYGLGFQSAIRDGETFYLVPLDNTGIWYFSYITLSRPERYPNTGGFKFQNGIRVNHILYLMGHDTDGIWTFNLRSGIPKKIESTAHLRFYGGIHSNNILYLTALGSNGIWAFDLKNYARPVQIQSTNNMAFREIVEEWEYS